VREQDAHRAREEIADRWQRSSRTFSSEDQPCALRLAAMIRAHARDPLVGISDPLEAALLAVLIEILKEVEQKRKKN
jgi:hypothetical protein